MPAEGFIVTEYQRRKFQADLTIAIRDQNSGLEWPETKRLIRRVRETLGDALRESDERAEIQGVRDDVDAMTELLAEALSMPAIADRIAGLKQARKDAQLKEKQRLWRLQDLQPRRPTMWPSEAGPAAA
jgi:hypothetical protein